VISGNTVFSCTSVFLTLPTTAGCFGAISNAIPRDGWTAELRRAGWEAVRVRNSREWENHIENAFLVDVIDHILIRNVSDSSHITIRHDIEILGS
jgi:hypothetical protein